MLFNSYSFVILLLITFILYYIPKFRNCQVLILIVSSLVFYAYDKPEFTLLLLFSAILNIVTSYYIVYKKTNYKKSIALTGVFLNLLLLCFFKYSPLISSTLFDEDSSIGEYMLYLPLPIGISFFTFEGISLLIDVWKEKYVKGDKIVNKSFIKHSQYTLFFISFFPHLIAGPILKAHDFYPQIEIKYFRNIRWESVFKTLILGYFFKMVVADNLNDYTFLLTFPFFKEASSLTLLAYVWGFSCQIFADFAGYSLIAIGLGRLFGYELNQNFNFPYISTSFKEFWKRWHMSLSTFLMEYLYFPLGGNRKGKYRTYFNLILTMTLGGLWHGVAWSYALWGFIHGALLAIERLITNNDNSKSKSKVFTFFYGSFIFTVVSFLWLLFKLPNIDHVKIFFECLFDNFGLYNNIPNISYIIVYSLPVVIYHLFYLFQNSFFIKQIRRIDYIGYAILLFCICMNSGASGAFIYFQF